MKENKPKAINEREREKARERVSERERERASPTCRHQRISQAILRY